MPEPLGTVSPTHYPVAVHAPSDSDAPLASGQLRTCIQQLKDRTDDLDRRVQVVQQRHIADISHTQSTSDDEILPAWAGDTWVDAGFGTHLFAKAAVGDVIVVQAHGVVRTNVDIVGRIAPAYAQGGLSAPGDYVQMGEGVWRQLGDNRPHGFSICAMRTITTAGDVRIQIHKISDDKGNVVSVYGPFAMICTWMRAEK
jgi:hypothetical protein